MSARSFWFLIATSVSMWSTLLLLIAIDGQGSMTSYRVSGLVLLTVWWIVELVTALDGLWFPTRDMILGVVIVLVSILANVAITAAIRACCASITHEVTLIVSTVITNMLVLATFVNQWLPKQPNGEVTTPRR
ncbi:hypothetical protein HYV21_00835 [Candidatus Microgenomates bacterium]|nr:hypothetical protein [Candidatus Microgenomates bacterium]